MSSEELRSELLQRATSLFASKRNARFVARTFDDLGDEGAVVEALLRLAQAGDLKARARVSCTEGHLIATMTPERLDAWRAGPRAAAGCQICAADGRPPVDAWYALQWTFRLADRHLQR